MNPLQILALLNLPRNGFDSLFKLNKLEVNKVLSTSIYTPQDIVNNLAKSNEVTLSTRALRRTDDVELLKKVSKKDSTKAIGALWNPLLPSDILEEKINSKNRTISFLSFIHPNTPSDLRESNLTPDVANLLTDIGGSLGEGVIRAYELVNSNKFIFDKPDIWPNLIKRAIISSPHCTTENFELIKKSGWSHWEQGRNLPQKFGVDINSLTIEELLSQDSTATDMLLVLNEKTTESDIIKLITKRRKLQIEPQVYSRIVERFGMELFVNSRLISDTRVISTAFRTPMFESFRDFYKFSHTMTGLNNNLVSELKECSATLSTPAQWELFLKLLPQWDGTPSQLVEVALKI